MDIDSAFPSKYLKASDLAAAKAGVRVAMNYVETEAMDDDDESKPVLYFQGKAKGLVLNRTNAAVISGAFGPQTEEWSGKPIILFATSCLFRGRKVDCIRVRIPDDVVPAAAQPQAGDAIPF